MSGPPVVASTGRTALRISESGFADPVSSEYQKAISSAMIATAVTPLSPLNEAGLTSTVTPFLSSSASAVRFLISEASNGVVSTIPQM
jgi:hypothetical protein